ncbi:hypothetical protein CM49_05943 [Paenibacillus sp. P1XP2]|nr:hypothetical protein CM49_05943 [Paenibacillus sp. P1XP2]
MAVNFHIVTFEFRSNFIQNFSRSGTSDIASKCCKLAVVYINYQVLGISSVQYGIFEVQFNFRSSIHINAVYSVGITCNSVFNCKCTARYSRYTSRELHFDIAFTYQLSLIFSIIIGVNLAKSQTLSLSQVDGVVAVASKLFQKVTSSIFQTKNIQSGNVSFTSCQFNILGETDSYSIAVVKHSNICDITSQWFTFSFTVVISSYQVVVVRQILQCCRIHFFAESKNDYIFCWFNQYRINFWHFSVSSIDCTAVIEHCVFQSSVVFNVFDRQSIVTSGQCRVQFDCNFVVVSSAQVSALHCKNFVVFVHYSVVCFVFSRRFKQRFREYNFNCFAVYYSSLFNFWTSLVDYSINDNGSTGSDLITAVVFHAININCYRASWQSVRSVESEFHFVIFDYFEGLSSFLAVSGFPVNVRSLDRISVYFLGESKRYCFQSSRRFSNCWGFFVFYHSKVMSASQRNKVSVVVNTTYNQLMCSNRQSCSVERSQDNRSGSWLSDFTEVGLSVKLKFVLSWKLNRLAEYNFYRLRSQRFNGSYFWKLVVCSCEFNFFSADRFISSFNVRNAQEVSFVISQSSGQSQSYCLFIIGQYSTLNCFTRFQSVVAYFFCCFFINFAVERNYSFFKVRSCNFVDFSCVRHYPSHFCSDFLASSVFEFNFSFFVRLESFFQSHFYNFTGAQSELDVFTVVSYFVGLNGKVDDLLCLVSSVNQLFASSVSLEVQIFGDQTFVDCCLHISFSPSRSAVVSVRWNFKFQCTNQCSSHFLNGYFTVVVEDLFYFVLTFHDAGSSYCFDVRNGPVFSVVAFVFVRQSASYFFQTQKFSQDFRELSASHVSFQVSLLVWVTIEDSFSFQGIIFLLYGYCGITECYRSKHGECHCCRQSDCQNFLHNLLFSSLNFHHNRVFFNWVALVTHSHVHPLSRVGAKFPYK